MLYDVKISVVKQVDTGGIMDEYAIDTFPRTCYLVKKNQDYVSKHMDPPPGFCGWAWADIQRDVAHMAMGSDVPWIKIPGTMITCCTDGLRPVIFKLERLPTGTE